MKREKNNTEKESLRSKSLTVQGLIAVAAILWAIVVLVQIVANTNNNHKANTIAEQSTETKDVKKNKTNKKSKGAKSDFKIPSKEEQKKLLRLVNKDHLLPDDFKVELTTMNGIHSVASTCYDELIKMLSDCRKKGLSPVICSSYRTQDKQESLFENRTRRFVRQGYTESEAIELAKQVVSVPGGSEHQIGLAVDIVDINNQHLDSFQENTQTQRWLMNNSWKYGFVLRYPSEKSYLTGIIYEPWHYRYVGKYSAKYMYDNDMCLEEYLKFIKKEERKAQKAAKHSIN